MYGKLIKIVKGINFSITGENSHGKFEVRPTSFMELSRCPETAIVVGTIITGKTEKGNSLNLVFSKGEPVSEIAENLQIQHKDVPSAEKSMSIGIKLSRMTFQALKDRNAAGG